MRLLLITNLYPPQELGGYGRCMADFCWGLQHRGHHVHVLCNNAPYLGETTTEGPSGEPVIRDLQLKGDFHNGVHLIQDPSQQQRINQHNQNTIQILFDRVKPDGILLGNLDLIGVDLLHWILSKNSPVLHHVGFVTPPFPRQQQPNDKNYTLLAASRSVRANLCSEGINAASAPIIYPGARTDLYGPDATDRQLPDLPYRYTGKPLKLCFAGLLMESKSPHTILEAVAQLREQGYPVHAGMAGGEFQKSYVCKMKSFCSNHNIKDKITFYKQLTRDQLSRFFRLHHAMVFPSVHPEAFGIVAVEAMASGLALISSGAGGASEVFEHNRSGLRFEAGNSHSLAEQIKRLFNVPGLLGMLQENGRERASNYLDVRKSAKQIEAILVEKIKPNLNSGIQQF